MKLLTTAAILLLSIGSCICIEKREDYGSGLGGPLAADKRAFYDKRYLPKKEGLDKRGFILDLLTGGKSATDYISCCTLMPQVTSLVNEANQLRLSVAGCQAKLQEVVNKIVGTKQGEYGNS